MGTIDFTINRKGERKMFTFIAKTEEEAYQKIENRDWFVEAVKHLCEIKGQAMSLGLALEAFEVSLGDKCIDHNQISFGNTLFTRTCKEMITSAYYMAIGSLHVNGSVAFCLQPNRIRENDVRKKIKNIREGIYHESDIDDIEQYIIKMEQTKATIERMLKNHEM